MKKSVELDEREYVRYLRQKIIGMRKELARERKDLKRYIDDLFTMSINYEGFVFNYEISEEDKEVFDMKFKTLETLRLETEKLIKEFDDCRTALREKEEEE